MTMTAEWLAPASSGLSWRRLARLAGAAQCLGLVVVAAALGDAEAAAVAGATLVGLLLLRVRGGTLGVVVLALLFADVAFFTGAAAATNLIDRAAPWATIASAALAATALVGLVASVARLLGRARSTRASASARAVAPLAVAAFAVVATAALFSGSGASALGAEVLRLDAKSARFSSTALVANGRTVTVRFANRDLFWHTFTMDELGIDLKVPVGGEKEVTFTMPPGTYTYYCAVPGHASAGMRGTLTIR